MAKKLYLCRVQGLGIPEEKRFLEDLILDGNIILK